MMIFVLYILKHLFSVVKVDNLVSQWQQIGVETPHDTSLEDVLTEVRTLSYYIISLYGFIIKVRTCR